MKLPPIDALRATLLAFVTLALFDATLLAQQPVLYNNGDTNGTAYSTTTPNDPTTLTIVSGNATQSGAITGTGALIKDGAGTLILGSYSNTLSGTTTVSAGTLQFSGGAGLPSSAVTLDSGATLRVDNFSTATVGSLSGSGALSFQYGELDAGGNNASTTFSGSLAGSGTLVKTGSGTLTFTGTSTGGQLAVSGGTLVFTPSSAGNYYGPVIVNSGGALTFSPADPSKFVRNVSVHSGGTATISLPNSTPLAATDISVNGGSLTLNGFGSTALSATTLYLDSNGTAHLPETVTLGGIGGFGSGTLALSGFNGFGDISVGANNISSYFGGTLSTTGVAATHFYKIGTGTWTLGSSLGSAPMVLAGYVALVSGGEANNVALQGGGLRYDNAMTHTGGIVVQTGGGTIDTGSNNVTLSGGIAGGSLTPGVDQLIKLGSGTLTLTGDAFGFTGTLALSAGVVSIASTANLGTAASPVYFGGGTLNTTASFTSAHPVTLNAGGGTFDIATGATLTWSGNITGAAGNSLTKIGAGTLLLGGNNSYSGDTNVNVGTLRLGSATALSPNSKLNVADGASFDANGYAPTFADLSGAGAIDVGSGGFAVAPTGTSSFGGTLGGAGGFTMSGSGTLTLGAANTYAGATAIGTGTVKLGAAGALPGGSPVSLAGGGTLDLNGHAATLGSLTGESGTTVALNSGANLTVTQSGNSTFAGALTGDGGLMKSGTGLLQLTGTNTFSGATAINAGELKLNGSAAASAFTINAGGTLSGNGTVGALTIASGGTLSPGNSPGNMNAGDTVWSPGGTYEWQINNADGSAGIHFDFLSITGTLDLSALADADGSRFTLSLVSLLPDNSPGLLANFNPAANYTYTIATASSGILGFNGDAISIDRANFANSAPGTWSLALGNSSHDLNLSYTAAAIPEPATCAALAGLAALGLAFFRRRRA